MCSSDEKKTKRLLKELPFYNMPIEKPKIKKLKNIEMLRELPFYDELNIVKSAKALKNYARSYSMEIIKDKDENLNDPLIELETRKSVIKVLFRDLLIEMKGFKYQMTLKVLLSKQKTEDIDFLAVYFNSVAKRLINLNEHGLNKSFQQILYTIDN